MTELMPELEPGWHPSHLSLAGLLSGDIPEADYMRSRASIILHLKSGLTVAVDRANRLDPEFGYLDGIPVASGGIVLDSDRFVVTEEPDGKNLRIVVHCCAEHAFSG